MALFYFDVNDNGHDFPDDQGTDCRDFDHVKEEAIRSLVELIGESLPDGDHHKLKIRVRDDGGHIVLQAVLNFDVEIQRRSRGASPDQHA